MVVLFHAGSRIGVQWLPGGYLAVDLFFMLSGFVIAHAYEHRMGRLGLAGFMKARLIRLYPAYLLGLGVALALGLVLWRTGQDGSISLFDVLGSTAAHAFYLPWPPSAPKNLFPFLVPAWSLMFEMAVNLAYCALFPWLSNRALLAITATAFLACILSLILDGSLVGGEKWSNWLTGFARVLFAFPLGVLIYRNKERLNFASGFAFLAIPAIFFWASVPNPILRDSVFVFLIAPLVVIIGMNWTPKYLAITAALATASYPLYIIHHPVLMLVGGFSTRLGVSPIIPVLGVSVLLVFVCIKIEQYYERPIRKRLAAFFRTA